MHIYIYIIIYITYIPRKRGRDRFRGSRRAKRTNAQKTIIKTPRITRKPPKLNQIHPQPTPDHPNGKYEFSENLTFLTSRTASKPSKSTSRNPLLRQFLKEIPQEYNAKAPRITRKAPKLNQIHPQPTPDHPNRKYEFSEKSTFLTSRTTSETS